MSQISVPQTPPRQRQLTGDGSDQTATFEEYARLIAEPKEVRQPPARSLPAFIDAFPSPLYDEFADGHGRSRVDRQIDCKSSSAKEKPMRTESLWMNYRLN
ncbi:MAG: hypothetical protein U0941_28455 [Planctomycetaceae bacterium]